MSAPGQASAGQAAYEAWHAKLAEHHPGVLAVRKPQPWDLLSAEARAEWETAAQAGIDAFLAGDSVSAGAIREALAAREPGAADGLPPQELSSPAELALWVEANHGDHPEWVDELRALLPVEPQPAPGLARLRDGITALAEDLEHSAAATAPSKKSAIEETVAQRLRKLLEGK